MAQEVQALALNFLEEQPDAAVRILEQHDAAQVATFLESVPESYSVLVLERSLVAFAAHLCRLMQVERATALLLELELSRMVTILRYLDRPLVEAILQDTPKSRRTACQLLLHFSLQSVGAWMVPNTAVVTTDFTVEEVLNFLKDATEETFSKYVFVVDREGRPQGRISYLSLLKARPQQQMGRLMETDTDVLSGQMLLAQAAKRPCWERGDVMPVVGLQHQFIGVIRHVDLRRGLQYLQQGSARERQRSDPLSGLVEVYGQSLLALFNTVSDVVEPEQPDSGRF